MAEGACDTLIYYPIVKELMQNHSMYGAVISSFHKFERIFENLYHWNNSAIGASISWIDKIPQNLHYYIDLIYGRVNSVGHSGVVPIITCALAFEIFRETRTFLQKKQKKQKTNLEEKL